MSPAAMRFIGLARAYVADYISLVKIGRVPQIGPTELLDRSVADAFRRAKERNECPGLLVAELQEIERTIEDALSREGVTVEDMHVTLLNLSWGWEKA